MLPTRLEKPLRIQLKRVQRQHDKDLSRGGGYVALSYALARKYPTPQRTCLDNGFSLPPARTTTPTRESSVATTSTRPWCNEP